MSGIVTRIWLSPSEPDAVVSVILTSYTPPLWLPFPRAPAGQTARVPLVPEKRAPPLLPLALLGCSRWMALRFSCVPLREPPLQPLPFQLWQIPVWFGVAGAPQ